MPRSEEISVSLVKSKLYDVTIATLRNEAKELQAAFGSIKVGDSVKAIKDQATASKEAAKAGIHVRIPEINDNTSIAHIILFIVYPLKWY